MMEKSAAAAQTGCWDVHSLCTGHLDLSFHLREKAVLPRN